MEVSNLALLNSSLVKPQQPPAPATTVVVTVISGDNRIDPLLGGAPNRFNDGSPAGTPVTVTYSFPTVQPVEYVGEDAASWKPFSAAQQAATRNILSLLQQQTKMTFQEVTDANGTNGTMRFSNNVQVDSAGYAIFPNSNGNPQDADTWISAGADADVSQGTYAYGTLVHEIGHAIGLKHPGNYNAGEPSKPVAGNFLGVEEETFFNTIMSYRQSAQSLSGIAFQPYDMLSIRYLYGTTPFQTGDTEYTYTDSSGLAINNIIDDGGIDTLNFSALTLPVMADLRPGAYNNVGKIGTGEPSLANLTTSFDALIEKVIGTGFADKITGNSANNTLTGGAGNDTINGGGGRDTALVNGTFATYTVTRGEGGTLLVNGADGTDTLTDVEQVQFSDIKVAFDTAANQPTGKAVLLLGATLSNALLQVKKPLIGPVAELFDNPAFSMQVLAGALMRLPIWGALAAGGAETATNTQIATWLLTSVNKVAPDAATLASAVHALDTELGAAQGTFLGALAESAANQVQVNLVGLANGQDIGPVTPA